MTNEEIEQLVRDCQSGMAACKTQTEDMIKNWKPEDGDVPCADDCYSCKHDVRVIEAIRTLQARICDLSARD